MEKRRNNNPDNQEPFVDNIYGIPISQGIQLDSLVDGVSCYIQKIENANRKRVPDPPKDEKERLVQENQRLTRENGILRDSVNEYRSKFNTLLYHCTLHEEDNEKLREIVKSLRAENASLFSRMEFLETMVSQLKGDTPV